MTSSLPPPPSAPPAERPASVVPDRRWKVLMWVGVGVGLLGLILYTVAIAASMPEFRDDIDALHRATAGDPVTFRVEEAVDWRIFLEPATASQSGLRYEVTDEDGDVVSLGRSARFSYEWFGDSGREIASVDLAPGTYTLTVISGTSTLGIGQSPGSATWRVFVSTFLVASPLVVGGAALAIVGAIKDTRRRNQTATPPAASAWSSGEWPAEPGR
ncbi:MAG: hypothetical protein AAF548_05995 [Actinomycetota bacterium]